MAAVLSAAGKCGQICLLVIPHSSTPVAYPSQTRWGERMEVAAAEHEETEAALLILAREKYSNSCKWVRIR